MSQHADNLERPKCKNCGGKLVSEEVTELDGYCLECDDYGVPARDRRIREQDAEIARLKRLR
jgi:hypothetical protein